MASITENISYVRQQIALAATQADRSASDITLLAVSKKQSPDKIRLAYEAGQRHFGENYVQEALEKIHSLSLNEIVWHFIGPIQSNKTRDIANNFAWAHSVERLKIARRLSEQRDPALPALNVCVQVNLSGEQSKSGVAIEEAKQLCEEVAKLPSLRLRGLMAIPAAGASACDYAPLNTLFKELQKDLPSMDTLSIGMSGDFAAAIAAGSTLVRIGTAIFGER
ncbi:MAG: YggS family pyridoxal phosphate-dependent enzyme [Pseudohongiellaceae bacterium]|nr:YggS family pyridoxal phosphate-dependent enzyme [Pseudohongiellaceae bacterium]